jgi:hypothetical protein
MALKRNLLGPEMVRSKKYDQGLLTGTPTLRVLDSEFEAQQDQEEINVLELQVLPEGWTHQSLLVLHENSRTFHGEEERQ